MGSLRGRTALVTGASRGIGRGIARRLAADGALVAVHYASNEEAAERTVAAIRDDGGRCFPVRAELGVDGDVGALFAAFDAGARGQGAGPELDILVNNAAVSISSRIADLRAEDFDRLIAVNTRAPLFVIQEALKRMGDGGRIVNISSAASRRALPRTLAYSMSKGAVDSLTRTLAEELGPRGITVNAVAPGFVETEMNSSRRATEEARSAIAALSAFDRIGRPEDIADIVAFLASDDSRWITGQYIDATGGSKL
ncbi:SDR family oxidoreductase [Streptomyces sp. NBC_00247]|uniref:SDR family oxidoreductase n=1 Tax=Streptomyces sp. NBC_00247 TaxID=2975689 RepID=UPI002E2D04C7|nr:SDR family oxidoreductase [Streptomyces sp. NBC_00247]